MSHLKQFTHFQPGGRIHPANSARNCPPSCNSLPYNDFKPGENSTRRENSAQFKVLDTKELLNPANPAPLKGECPRALAARAHPSPRAGKVYARNGRQDQNITSSHPSLEDGGGDVEVPPRARIKPMPKPRGRELFLLLCMGTKLGLGSEMMAAPSRGGRCSGVGYVLGAAGGMTQLGGGGTDQSRELGRLLDQACAHFGFEIIGKDRLRQLEESPL